MKLDFDRPGGLELAMVQDRGISEVLKVGFRNPVYWNQRWRRLGLGEWLQDLMTH